MNFKADRFILTLKWDNKNLDLDWLKNKKEIKNIINNKLKSKKKKLKKKKKKK